MRWLRNLIDDIRFHVWMKHQNGNKHLQEMMGNLAIIEDQLFAATGAIRSGDKHEAIDLIGQAHVTVREHMDTLREIL
jgi:hypothetical protein